MAPAAFLSSGTVHTLCPTSSATNRWQPKRLLSSRSALTRGSLLASMGKAAVKSSIPFGFLDCVFGRRRKPGLGPETGCPSRHVFTAAVEGRIAVDETSAAPLKVSESEEELISETATATVVSLPTKAERFKPRIPGQKARREDPLVPGEALVEGAVFTGKVTTIQPFGAFVNFGAFTDGLVHISKMSTGYVSDVSDIVSLGQEVKVTILNVEQKSGRIALSMVDKEGLESKEVAPNAGETTKGSEKSPSQQGPDGRPVNRGRIAGGGRQNRRDEPQKSLTKLTKGIEVEGIVKNKIRAGVFVELSENDEGFLRYSDIPGGENMASESSLQIGEKINATVLRIDRGKVVLTMKPMVDVSSVNRDINLGRDSGATNPFEIAFRAFNLIPAEAFSPFEEDAGGEEIILPEPETDVKEVFSEGASPMKVVIPEVTDVVEESPVAEQELVPGAFVPVAEIAPLAEEESFVDDIMNDATSIVIDEEGSALVESPVTVEGTMIIEIASKADEISAESVLHAKAVVEETATADEGVSLEAIPEVAVVVKDSLAAVAPTVEDSVAKKVTVVVSAVLVKKLRDETGAGMMDCKRALADTRGDIEKAREALRKKGLAGAEKKASRIASEGLVGSYIHDSRIGVVVEVNCETDFVSRGPTFKSLVEDLGMQVVASQQVQFVSLEDIPLEIVNKEREMEARKEDLINKPEAIREKIVEGRLMKRLNEIALLEQPYIRDDKILVKDLVKQTVAALGENILVRRFERYVLGEGLRRKGSNFPAEVAAQTAGKAPVESLKIEDDPVPAPFTNNKVVVLAALVKELRDQTGAGMMDCKKALASTENDVEEAVEFLRKKGLASAEKKANRLASEGLIGTYIHDGRIGVLVEVNCETDFVSRGEKFKQLVEDLAMQLAAYPQIQVVSLDDVPAEMLAREVEFESGKEDLACKPEAIRARIVDGRVAKRLSEFALMEQPFIKDDKKLVKDILKEAIAGLGENIQVRRFTRFNLGEGVEKKVTDFASEVAAQAGRKV